MIFIVVHVPGPMSLAAGLDHGRAIGQERARALAGARNVGQVAVAMPKPTRSRPVAHRPRLQVAVGPAEGFRAAPVALLQRLARPRQALLRILVGVVADANSSGSIFSA